MNNNSLKAYILTIAGTNSARMLHAKKQWQTSGLRYEFVRGIEARDASLLTNYSSTRNCFRYKRPMSRSEIATYLGHRRLWQELLNSNNNFGLMLEDDATIINPKSFLQSMNDIVDSAQTGIWDVLKLFNYSDKKIIAYQIFGDTELICTKYPAYGAVAYIISRDAAIKLLSRSYIYRPIDEDLTRPWEFNLKVWSAAENLITEEANALGGSLLEEERNNIEKKAARNSLLYPFRRNILEASKTLHSFAYRRDILKTMKDNKKRS